MSRIVNREELHIGQMCDFCGGRLLRDNCPAVIAIYFGHSKKEWFFHLSCAITLAIELMSRSDELMSLYEFVVAVDRV